MWALSALCILAPRGKDASFPPTFPSALEAGANTRIHAGTCFPQKPAASDKKGRSLFLPERKEKQAQTQCRTRLTSAKTAMPPELLCFAAHHRKTAVRSHTPVLPKPPSAPTTAPTETKQSARPLLVGRAFVNTTPKALAAGTADLTYISASPYSAYGEAHAPCGSWASQSTPRTAS